MTDELSTSARKMLAEAKKMGIDCQVLVPPYLIKMKFEELEWLVVASRTSVQSSVGKGIADDKELTNKLLEKFAFPTAKFVVGESWEEIAGQMEKIKFPVVVKPTHGSSGQMVKVGLGSSKEVMEAVENKLAKGKWLVEEMLEGSEYRVVCVDYKLVAAAERLPAFVIGDGTSKLRELIDEKNMDPARGDGHLSDLAKIEIDDDLMKNIEKEEVGLDEVIQKGRKVVLRSVCNMSLGGESVDVTKEVCRENVELFERIARVFDLNIIGIDVMCKSLAEPLVKQSRAGIIEINASPGLNIHQSEFKKENVNVARLILEMTIRELRKV